MKKIIKEWDGECEYCGRTPKETEIVRAYASGTYICGEIECWNSYCFDWVWTGDYVEVTERTIEVCDRCEEEIDETDEIHHPNDEDVCGYCIEEKEIIIQ